MDRKQRKSEGPQALNHIASLDALTQTGSMKKKKINSYLVKIFSGLC